MKSSDEAARILSSYTDPSVQLEAEIDALKEDWYEKLDHLQIHTPDPAFNTMINTWNAYNCFITFVWSRAASFVYC